MPHTRSAHKIQATELDLEPHSIIPKNNLVTEVKQQIQSKKDRIFFNHIFVTSSILKKNIITIINNVMQPKMKRWKLWTGELCLKGKNKKDVEKHN